MESLSEPLALIGTSAQPTSCRYSGGRRSRSGHLNRPAAGKNNIDSCNARIYVILSGGARARGGGAPAPSIDEPPLYASALDYKHSPGMDYARNPRFHCILFVWGLAFETWHLAGGDTFVFVISLLL